MGTEPDPYRSTGALLMNTTIPSRDRHSSALRTMDGLTSSDLGDRSMRHSVSCLAGASDAQQELAAAIR